MHDDHSSHPQLAADLNALLLQARSRRGALRWLGGGAAVLAGCGGGGGSDGSASASSTASTTVASSSSTSSSSSSSTASSSCSTIPTETAGPYPSDGTNRDASGSVSNALALAGIVRQNIVSSFGSGSGSADGVALTVELTLASVGNACAALSGLAVYLWHADQLGRYSLYSSGATAANYLRGVQVSDSNGLVRFQTIVPGCYDGRWPHIHFEIYASQAAATTGANALKTTQLALPQAMAAATYADSRYTGSTANLAKVSLASDNIFSDGYSLQLASVSGSVTAGWTAQLQVGLNQ